MSLRSAIRPLDSHRRKVHAYVLQNDQRAIDTADGVVAQARLHGHHPRVYLVSGHGGCRSAACVLGFRSWYAGVCGVVLLYYRRVYVAGGCEAWWRRSMGTRDVGDGCCVGELDGPGAQMELACLLDERRQRRPSLATALQPPATTRAALHLQT